MIGDHPQRPLLHRGINLSWHVLILLNSERCGIKPVTVQHDDAEREFDYRVGAEQALSQAEADGWTVVSIKNDWATVFAS
jgi:hypothetical protein